MLAVRCGGKHQKEVFAGSTALAAPSELLARGCFAPHFWACTETERIMVEALGRGNLTTGGNGRGTGRARAAYVPQGCSQGATSFSQVSLSEGSSNLPSTWRSSRESHEQFVLSRPCMAGFPSHHCMLCLVSHKAFREEAFISESLRDACSGYKP